MSYYYAFFFSIFPVEIWKDYRGFHVNPVTFLRYRKTPRRGVKEWFKKHSFQKVLHACTYRKISLQNIHMKHWTHTPLKILLWLKLHINSFQTMWNTTIKKKKKLFVNSLFFKISVPRYFGPWNHFFLVHPQYSLENTAFCGLFGLLICFKFYFWFMSLHVIYILF